MQGDEEDIRVVVEDLVRAVPVVDIPIDDRDPREAVRALGVARGDGDVVEDAEAHPAIGRGMMAGWAHQRVGVLDRPRQGRIDRRDRPARRERGDRIAIRAHRRADARIAAPGRRDRAHVLDVGVGMDRAAIPPRWRPAR